MAKRKRGELVWHEFVQAKWAVTEPVFCTMQRVLSNRLEGVAATEAERAAATAQRLARERAAAARREIAAAGNVYVVPVCGIITQKASLMTEYSGGCAVEDVVEEVREAMAMPSVAAVVLDVDSPGGSVYGVPEAFAALKAMRGTKPLVALCDPIAASAAYWLACACDSISCIPSGEAGSVGVFMSHTDFSGMNEQIGIEVTYISAGKYKVEGNPDEPLSPDAKAYYQQQVNDTYDDFVACVADGRGLSTQDVIDRFGQGRCLLAKDARAAGLVDDISTFDELIQRLTAPASGRSAKRRGKRAEPRRADHTDVGRGEDGKFATQCECHADCGCMKGGDTLCEKNCMTCQPSCACLTGVKSATSLKADENNEYTDAVDPDEHGNCPDGYELDEETGLCVPIADGDDGPTGRSRGDRRQAAAGGRHAGVVPHDVSEETAPKDTPWEKPSLGDFGKGDDWSAISDSDKRHIAGHYAWAPKLPPDTFGELELPHHRASDGKVVFHGVTAAAGRLDQSAVPEADRGKVRTHLSHHYGQFNETPPWESESDASSTSDEADRVAVSASAMAMRTKIAD